MIFIMDADKHIMVKIIPSVERSEVHHVSLYIVINDDSVVACTAGRITVDVLLHV